MAERWVGGWEQRAFRATVRDGATAFFNFLFKFSVPDFDGAGKLAAAMMSGLGEGVAAGSGDEGEIVAEGPEVVRLRGFFLLGRGRVQTMGRRCIVRLRMDADAEPSGFTIPFGGAGV
jgi:hypothetical protein